GIIAGFVRDAWGRGWIWTSLVLFIVIAVIMFVRGSLYYSQIRRAVGMQWFDGRRAHDPESPQSEQEVSKLLNSRKPEETAMIGGVGLALILWLMMFRPF
ncbi:MAG: hypothetical protein HY257_03000, partial [Chloroflexi bacterium]|nr:hypothetical protein [Chloroflexota bacterium]